MMNRYQREQRLERLAQCPEGHDTRHFYGWLDEIDKLQAEIERLKKKIEELIPLRPCVNDLTREIKWQQARIKELEGAIRMLTTFFPEGWVMPLGWEQMVAQAKQALKG